MSKVSNTQLAEILEHIGNQQHVPQLVSHYDKSNVYSTDEQRVGIWIDGKPIYQKTVSAGTFPNKTTKVLAHGINNVERFVFIFSIMDDGSYWQSVDSAALQVGTTNALTVYADKTNVNINTNLNLSSNTGFVTLYYTKTTDSAVDYTIESTDNYSTSETLIGKWIDGKDLFQKTIDCGALPNASTKTVAHGITGLGYTVSIAGTSKRPSDGTVISLPRAFNGNCIDILTNSQNILITISVGNMTAFTQTYVTLKYTKA